ncbi:hypothetical protein [Streptomyces sp. NPDC021969]|uniref:hypothetical protein n=1 Tax=unclassified Streptomyces TaxID=2593676 RepID=UPI0033C83ACD
MTRWTKPRGVCECTDSIRSSLGTCPDRRHREFLCCPKQNRIKTKREETSK